MIRHLLALLCFAGISHTVMAEELITHTFGEKIFTIELPKSWIRNSKQEDFSVSSPDDKVALTASAYSKNDGSLSEFSDYRFSSVQEFYKPVGNVQTLNIAGGNGVFREYVGTWPGESKPTYYVVACLELGKTLISITYVTDPKNFKTNKAKYVHYLQSVKSGS